MPMAPKGSAAASQGAALILVLAALVPALGALPGDFVYDDRKQILADPLVQRPELFARRWRATSGRFEGDASEAWSSY